MESNKEILLLKLKDRELRNNSVKNSVLQTLENRGKGE